MLQLEQQRRDIVLGGDGRANSPGHSVKYGSYSTLELEASKVLDIQLIQSNECRDSYHMEKEGLQRSIAFLLKEMQEINILIADCHCQIGRWIRW